MQESLNTLNTKSLEKPVTDDHAKKVSEMESILRSRQLFESQIIKRLEDMAIKSKKQDDLNRRLLKQNKKLSKEIELYGLSLNATDHSLISESITLEIDKQSEYESESIEIKKLETISEEQLNSYLSMNSTDLIKLE